MQRLSFLTVSFVTAAASAQSITVLAPFTDGGFQSAASAMSSDGSTVVGFASNTDYIGPYRAAIWNTGSGAASANPVDLGTAGYSHAHGVNQNGSIVVGVNGGGGSFRWSASGGTQQLGSMTAGRWSTAVGVSGDGSVVVGYGNTKDQYNNEFTRAFRWTPTGGMQSIGAISPYGNSAALAVNSDGSVIVGESGTQAFRWTAETGMVGLGSLPVSCSARAVNADGSVIAGKAGYSAFRWTAATGMEMLLSDFDGQILANAMTSDGSIIVGQAGNYYTALIWQNSASAVSLWNYLAERGVSLSGWSSLTDAKGISADGRFISGYGVYNGLNRGFVVDLGAVPSPAASALLLASGLLARRRRD